jgi:hypothetical protein
MFGIAASDPKKDKAAVAKLEEVYAPIGKLAGAERVNRACTDAAQLQKAVEAISDEKAPPGASVDNNAWGSKVRVVGTAIDQLVEACAAPNRQLKVLNKVRTADEIVTAIDRQINDVFEASRKRALPAGLVTFRKTFDAIKVNKSFCAQAAKLAKQVTAFAKAPKGADAAAWQTSYDAVKASTTAMQCSKATEPDEVYAGNLEALRGKLDKLVVLAPVI